MITSCQNLYENEEKRKEDKIFTIRQISANLSASGVSFVALFISEFPGKFIKEASISAEGFKEQNIVEQVLHGHALNQS